jgi:hypothetical protein
MRLGALLAVAVLVLVTLVTAFPQVVERSEPLGRSVNTQDHMDFTRELADHSAKLDALKSQHDAMVALPERMARIEERLDVIGRMVWALLGGIFALLAKEIWSGMRAIRSRKYANGGG